MGERCMILVFVLKPLCVLNVEQLRSTNKTANKLKNHETEQQFYYDIRRNPKNGCNFHTYEPNY